MIDITKDASDDASATIAITRWLAYEFRDMSLLATALLHRSALDRDWPSVHGINNERLEFLGDAVLSLITMHS
jgi:dsRNA-specific ribonuclease